MSSFLDTMLERAKADKQTIVLPEGDDPRTLEAAETILAQGVANLIILGNVAAIKESGRALDGATLIDPQDSDLHDEFANTLYELRKHKGMTLEQAAEKVRDVLFFGVLMVKTGRADGMVSGACHSTGDVLRPSLQILKTAPGVKLVSSFFIMVVPNCEYGQNGTFLFSDCGLEIQPDAEKLAHIAVNSAQSWQTLIGTEPVVAMLSHLRIRQKRRREQGGRSCRHCPRAGTRAGARRRAAGRCRHGAFRGRFEGPRQQGCRQGELPDLPRP